MADDQAKGSVADRLENYHSIVEKVEEVKQPEVKPAQTKPAEVAPPKEEVKTESTEEPEEKEALANSKNPERTKAYIDKLKSKLKEATTPKEEPNPEESAFDSFHPERQVNGEPVVPQGFIPQTQYSPQQRVQTPYLNPLQVENITNRFIDQNGNVDINGLNNALQQSNYNAYQARLENQSLKQKIERIEESQQVREAHAAHPEIDPQNKESFNRNLFKLVTDRLFNNMYQGKHQSLSQVASEIKKEIGYAPKVDAAKERESAVEDYKKTQRARQQGPFEEGRGNESLDSASLSDLRKASRGHGRQADDAIAKRLKALGI